MAKYWHINICKISFNALYPNIISKLWKQGKLKFNIDEFAVIYSFMVDNINVIKNHNDISNTGRLLFKTLINFTYGALSNSTYSGFYVDNHHYISEYINHHLTKYKNDYSNNIIYINR